MSTIEARNVGERVTSCMVSTRVNRVWKFWRSVESASHGKLSMFFFQCKAENNVGLGEGSVRVTFEPVWTPGQFPGKGLPPRVIIYASIAASLILLILIIILVVYCICRRRKDEKKHRKYSTNGSRYDCT